MGTQLRLRSAKVLLINLGSVGMETVKNLVLGGINTIELMDNSSVEIEDFGAQFFLPNDDSIVGELKLPKVVESIKELNSRVDIIVNTNNFMDEIDNNKEYFKKFDLIIATELTRTQISLLNSLTRSFNIPLYVTGLHGMFGYIITDLIEHTSITEKDKGNQPRKPNTMLNLRKTITEVSQSSDDKETVTVEDRYLPIENIFSSNLLLKQLNRRQLKRMSPALSIILALFDITRSLDVDKEELRKKALEVSETLCLSPEIVTNEYLNHFKNQSFTEFAPTSAILGGCLAQDIIQYLSKKESPINNVLILDGLRSEMPIYTL